MLRESLLRWGFFYLATKEKQMTNQDFEIYLRKALDSPLGEEVVRWNVRDFWIRLSDYIYNKYGKPLIVPTHYCESDNPFTIHFTWDDKNGNVLGCHMNGGANIYFCFSHSSFYKDESDIFRLKTDSWKELLYLPNLKISDRLTEVFYLYYLEKHNGH